ncbi:hypothetical protein RHGRI_013921 [Rhododendron griersonianum]|uniref:Transposase n=1 Tax=Rhododendron griersonianum TaxID=479676 RepID=A0AAV6K7D8_9ERIC|nr:hypothetical protein RHGRI_013921 [Rhododendron griersonianum]
MLGVGPLDETIEGSGEDEDDEIPDVEMDPDMDYDMYCKNKMANGKRNFIKPCSLATLKKTKYEMARDERMKENNARLKAAGIDRILADLRGSSLPNCTNEKRRGTRNGVDDPDYMPPSIEDANDDESLDSLEHELQQIPSSGPTRSEVELQHDSTRVLERMTRSTPHLVVQSQPSPPHNVEIQSEAAAVSSAGKLLVHIPPEYRAPVGTYASKLASKIGVEDQFDFEGDPIDVNKAITSRCGRRLSDYTHRLYEKFKKLKATKGEAYARTHPPPQIAMEQWTRLIEKKWTNKDWLALKNEGQLPKLPEFYKSPHYNDGTGEWIAPKCQTNYEEMVRVDAALNQEGVTPFTGEQMSVTVLKKRPGYVKGLGLRPSPSIRTTSESALKALGLSPSSSATTHEYVSCLETKIESQNETIEKLLEANKHQQKINASMMEFLIEKGYTGHVGSAETSSND